MVTKEDKIKLFINEINDIKDSNLKEFTKELIANADDYFFTVAASSSGKYHPPFDLGHGGLVRHTKCVAFMAKSVAESMIFNERDTDLLIVAAIAHDIKKQGNGSGHHTVWEHPTLAMNYVYETYKNNNFNIPKEDIIKIGNAVNSHMGKWGNHEMFLKGNQPLPLPETEFEKALQIADYIASRKEITGFAFRPTEVPDAIVEETTKQETLKSPSEMSLTELENFRFTFGLHNGKTLKEVKSTGYLDWMLRTDNFKNKYAQDIARAYYNKVRESVTSDGREVVKEENKAFIKSQNIQQEEIDELPF